MKEQYLIIKNTERYPNIDKNLPNHIIVFCTWEKAKALAEILSNRNAGCDFSWYVLEED